MMHHSSLHIIAQLHCLRRSLSLLFILPERCSASSLNQPPWPTRKWPTRHHQRRSKTRPCLTPTRYSFPIALHRRERLTTILHRSVQSALQSSEARPPRDPPPQRLKLPVQLQRLALRRRSLQLPRHRRHNHNHNPKRHQRPTYNCKQTARQSRGLHLEST